MRVTAPLTSLHLITYLNRTYKDNNMTEARTNRTSEMPSAKKLGMQRNQFSSIEDKDLRCRNIATMILNYTEDHGQDAGLLYASMNVTDQDEMHIRGWIKQLADERGIWETH